MSKPDGGPAFPMWTEDMPVEGSPGMTLRDWFAGQALAGWLASFDKEVSESYNGEPRAWNQHQQEVARACYGYADAMLRERDR